MASHPTKQSRHGRSKNPKATKDVSHVIKGIVLCAAGALALAAGIYKGGEGLFFGVVFAMACGLLGILFIKQNTNKAKTGKR
jgi:hypothetical protein